MRYHDSQNPGRLPILAKLATRIQSAMMYGSWTWCHLNVTIWKLAGGLGSSSIPLAPRRLVSASASASSGFQPGPRAQCHIAAAQLRELTRIPWWRTCCALRRSPLRDPGAGSSQVPRPARVAFNPAAPSCARAGLSRPRCAHVNANSPAALEALPPALLTPTYLVGPQPRSPGSLGAAGS